MIPVYDERGRRFAVSMQSAAERLGCSVRTVDAHAVAYRDGRQLVSRPDPARIAGAPRPPPTPEQAARNAAIVAAHTAREPMATIAARHGISPAYASKLARRGGAPRRRKAPPPDRDALIVAAYRDGRIPISAISRRWRMSHARVLQIVQAAEAAGERGAETPCD